MAKISLDKTMEDIVSLKNQIDGLNMLLSQKKALMAKYFEKTGKSSVENSDCTVYIAERPNIIYDVDAIKEKLDKKLYTQFIDTSYSVSDWGSFISFCKRKGISGKEIRSFFSVQGSVNQAKLSKLYEKGVIALSDLVGCYSAEVKKSVVLRMKNVDREIPITSPDSKAD